LNGTTVNSMTQAKFNSFANLEWCNEEVIGSNSIVPIKFKKWYDFRKFVGNRGQLKFDDSFAANTGSGGLTLASPGNTIFYHACICTTNNANFASTTDVFLNIKVKYLIEFFQRNQPSS